MPKLTKEQIFTNLLQNKRYRLSLGIWDHSKREMNIVEHYWIDNKEVNSILTEILGRCGLSDLPATNLYQWINDDWVIVDTNRRADV